MTTRRARCAYDTFEDRSRYRDVGLVINTRNMIAPLLTKEGRGSRRLVKV